MRPLTPSFPGQLRHGPLVAFGFFVFAILLAYKSAQHVITNDVDSLAFAGMAFVGGVIIVAILNNWRQAAPQLTPQPAAAHWTR